MSNNGTKIAYWWSFFLGYIWGLTGFSCAGTNPEPFIRGYLKAIGINAKL